MNNILISLFTLGWMEVLDPQGYALILGLSTVVKKKWHTMLYIIVSYVTYALSGLLIFLGVDQALKNLILPFLESNWGLIYWIRLGLGVLGLIGFIWLGLRLLKQIRGTGKQKEEEEKSSEAFTIKSVHPAFIVLLSVVFTVVNMTGAAAMVAFIAVMSLENVTVPQAAVLLFVYTIFALIPKLILYYVIYYCRNPKILKIKDKMPGFFRIVFAVIIWLFFGFLALWGGAALIMG